jgi:hypothetical protein
MESQLRAAAKETLYEYCSLQLTKSYLRDFMAFQAAE